MLFDEAMIIHSQRDDGRHWLTTIDMPSMQLAPVAPNHCRAGHFLLKVISAKLAQCDTTPSALVLTRADSASLATWLAPDGGAGAEVALQLAMCGAPDDGDGEDSDQFLTPQPPAHWTQGYDAWIAFAGRALGIEVPDADLDPDGHVQEMEKATAAFQQRLPQLRARYLAGMDGLNLGFKLGLATGAGGMEYVWVQPTGWQDPAVLACTLESEPHDCAGYSYGQQLAVPVTQLTDYAIGSEEAGLVEPGVTQRIAENYGLIIS